MPALVENGFYNKRATPWHGLGKPVDGFLNAAGVLEAAGLDWTVSRRPIYQHLEDPMLSPSEMYSVVPGYAAVCRDTDNRPYGVVGSRYEPAQNVAVLSFLDEIVGSGQAVYDTAWSLKDGETVAITILLPEVIKPAEGEEISVYVTAMNTHGGMGSIRFIVSPVRVVCMNTLALALTRAKLTWSRKHTINALSAESLSVARDALQLSEAYAHHIDEAAKELLSEAFSVQSMNALAGRLLMRDMRNPSDKELHATEELLHLWHSEENLSNIRFTKWGALNAVAEFADYHLKYRGKNASDSRTESILVGRSSELKTRAYDYLRS